MRRTTINVHPEGAITLQQSLRAALGPGYQLVSPAEQVLHAAAVKPTGVLTGRR